MDLITVREALEIIKQNNNEPGIEYSYWQNISEKTEGISVRLSYKSIKCGVCSNLLTYLFDISGAEAIRRAEKLLVRKMFNPL